MLIHCCPRVAELKGKKGSVMLKVSTVVVFFLLLMPFSNGTILAQSAGNCDTTALATSLESYADVVSSASYDEVKTAADEINALLAAYVDSCEETPRSAGAADELFTVQATGDINIRSCAETTCSVISAARSGQVYSVVGQSGDWYEIQLEDGDTGYVASWLTVRGPDAVFDIYEGYFDISLNCSVLATVNRSTTSSVRFAITGDSMNDVTIDIFRPSTTNAEPVWRQFVKSFIDTGETYLDQVYRSSYWPSGSYQLSLAKDDEIRRYGVELTEPGETIIYVLCD